jgi:hypothetical protein
MADNVAITPGSGENISAEEVTTLNGSSVSAVKVQRTGIALITANSTAVDLPGDATNGLLVNLGANNDITVTGSVTANAGTNLNTSALALESGGNLAAAATSLATLDNIVAGNEAQVDVVTLPSGSVAATTAKTSDFDSGAGTDTVAMFGVALPASGGAVAGGTSTNPLRVDPTGSTTQPVSGTVALGAGSASVGTLGANSGVDIGDVTINNASGASAVNIQDGGNSITVDGTVAATQSGNWTVRVADGAGNALTSKAPGSERALSVAIVDGSGAQVTSFGGSGGTSMTDDAAFTPASGAFTPMGGIVTSDSVDSGDGGAFAMLANRQQKVTLYDSSGVELAVGGGTQYDEDTAHVSGDKLTMAGVVRRDTAASGVGSDGDRDTLSTDASGRLHVNVGNTVTVASHAVTNAGTFPVQAAQSGTWTVQPGNTANSTAWLVTGAGGTFPVTDSGGSLTVDGTVGVSGTVTVDSELTTADLDTGAGTDTRAVVGLVFGASGGGTLVSTTNPLPVGDNGGSLTVDGSVSLAAAIPAGTNNIGDVDILSIAAGDNNIGNVDIASIAAGDNNIGNVDIVTMPNVTLAAGTNTNEVVGDAAHDAAAAGNPVLVAARANANEPTAVSADGDVTHLWADLLGRLVVITGHPSPEAPATVNATASGNTTVIAAPGASLSLYICKGSIHNSGSANITAILQDGASGTARWAAELASEGGGSLFDFGARGWKLTANTLLNVNLSGAGDVRINITDYYIAA